MTVMMLTELENKTVRELSLLARNSGICGWHDMRKHELIKALKKTVKTSNTKKSVKTICPIVKKTTTKKAQEKTPEKSIITVKRSTPALNKATGAKNQTIVASVSGSKNGKKTKTSFVEHSAQNLAVTKPHFETPQKIKQESSSDSLPALDNPTEIFIKYRGLGGIFDHECKDVLILQVRDHYWLQAFWELSVRLLERAKAAMGVHWHTAIPVLRVYQLVSDGISKQQRNHLRDIKLRGNINNWYIDVQNPPAVFLVEIGYVSTNGKFFPLASSNIVETMEDFMYSKIENSAVKLSDATLYPERFSKRNGMIGENHQGIRRHVEEPFRPSLNIPLLARFSDGGISVEPLKVEVSADVVIYGKTHPGVQLTIKNEPVSLSSDGQFSIRFQLPEKRQVYPIVAVSVDGIESQTTVLSIDKNTKALEIVHEEME
ncbi:MAG: DUF4912 domain-containing protein [Planctomycetaceae bacterium]|jgi:hypothetical protein|nr:DUF4912 domain-containing protein [Planctomycetaceae bacterium]